MPATERQSWSHLWETLKQSSRPHISWTSAIWRGALVGLAVTAGALTGHLEFGAAVGFGMLGPAMLPATMTRVDILRVCTVLTVLVPVLGLVAILLAESWWLLLFMPAAGYFFGCVANAGPAAAMLTVPSIGAAIALSATPIPVTEALWSGLFLLVGSLIGTLVAAESWRFERASELRKAIGAALATLEQLAREGKTDGRLTLVSASALSNSAIALSQAALPYKKHSHFAEVLQTANQLRLTMAAWTATDPDLDTRTAVADEISLLISAFLRDDPRTSTIEIDLPPDLMRDIGLFASAITGHSMVPVTLPQAKESTTPMWLGQMGALLRPNGPVARQGFRLALGMALATVVWLLTGIGHGYWITMAVAMVLKGDYVTTLTKGLLRIAGTIASVVILAALLTTFGHSPTTYCVLMIVSTPFMIHWVMANYFFASLAIASTMLLLSEAVAPGFVPAADRLIDTVIGCVIAVVAFLLIPAWRGDQLPDALRQVLEHLRDWSQVIFEIAQTPGNRENPGFARSDPASIERRSQAREFATRSRLAMVAVTPIVDAALIEPRRTAYDPGQGLAVYVAAEGYGLATLALELATVEGKESAKPETLAKAHQQILDDLDAAILRLKSPGQLVDRPVEDERPDELADAQHTQRLVDQAHRLQEQTALFWRR